jgi:lipoprotein signal peptidase
MRVLFFKQLKVVFAAGVILCVLDLLLKSTLPEVIINKSAGLGFRLIAEESFSYLVVAIFLLAVAAMFYLFLRDRSVTEQGLFRVAVFLLIVGFSNVFDRYYFGGVRDYINLGLFWVNIADIAITWSIIHMGRIYLQKA